MGRRKPKSYENIQIEGFADNGRCIAHFENLAMFVKGVAPGDIVDVTAIKRKNFLEATPTRFVKLSENRTKPKCEHFNTCGGCKWQHVEYRSQLKEKEKIVFDSLSRIAKVELPPINQIIGSDHVYQYRNKLEYTFSNRRWLTREEIDSGKEFNDNAVGFHVPKLFDRIVDINQCHLQAEPTNHIRNEIRGFALENGLSFYDINKKTGFLRNLIIRTTSTEELMVIVQVGENNHKAITLLLDHLKKSFPEITSLLYVINTKGNETFFDLELHTFSGQDFIEEKMKAYSPENPDLKFRIGPKSFFQTNTYQAETLYRIALDFASLKGDELIYDLYTGTGTIALYASHEAKKVIGVEYVTEAIEDAKLNAIANGIDNVHFFAGDMKDVLTENFVKDNGQPDIIITDPPRAGMHADVIERLNNIQAKKIVYISCNPATQARDLALLDNNYQVTKVQPVDMFPHTSHVESVVLLELK